MLTIQPNLTNYSSKINFKQTAQVISEDDYRAAKGYYEQKSREFDKLMNDDYLPPTAKKGARIFKIVSEGILKGLAVAWGATVAASFIKGLKTNKIAKFGQKIAKPAGEKISEAGKATGKKITELYTEFTKTDFAQKIAKKAQGVITKIDENKYGHYALEGTKYAISGIKKAAGFVEKAVSKIVQPIKKITYDKFSKATSTTLGVGSGIAGAYEAGRNPNNDNETVDNEVSDGFDDEIPDFDQGDE